MIKKKRKYADMICDKKLKRKYDDMICDEKKEKKEKYDDMIYEMIIYYTVIWSAAVRYLIYLARESRYWAKRKLSPISVSLAK